MMKPIIFNTEMVQAILDGRKTQTRRVIKPQPQIVTAQDGMKLLQIKGKGVWFNNDPNKVGKYQVGDKLYVRETFARAMATAYRLSPRVVFTPDPSDPSVGAVYKAGWTRVKPGPWKPSIHMPKWASRIALEIKDVRVARVQDITEADAKAEGCYRLIKKIDNVSSSLTKEGFGLAYSIKDDVKARVMFQKLWDSINLKRGYGWDTNCYVWVVEFSVINP